MHDFWSNSFHLKEGKYESSVSFARENKLKMKLWYSIKNNKRDLWMQTTIVNVKTKKLLSYNFSFFF